MNCHRNNTGNASVTELVTEKADKPLKRSDLDRRLLASSAPHAAEMGTTFRMALEALIVDFALSLYPCEVVLYCQFKCKLVQGRDVYQYGTRGRDNIRIQQHRTATFDRLSSEVGIKLINELPDETKMLMILKNSKLD
ncbi:hypothetical protein J6590_003718 [Homalodisca vitripennis]|nr:hypothetical protein J6590_003718 [Homalodisca vitripennis]